MSHDPLTYDMLYGMCNKCNQCEYIDGNISFQHEKKFIIIYNYLSNLVNKCKILSNY